MNKNERDRNTKVEIIAYVCNTCINYNDGGKELV